MLEERVEAATSLAREILETKVQSRLQPELERLDSEIRHLESQNPEETGEGRSLRALKDSLASWSVRVEGVGLLSRNGGLGSIDAD